MDRSWRELAKCQGMDPDIFFPESTGRGRGSHVDWATPRAVCDVCPVREACLEEALEEEGSDGARYRSGMRGGMTPKERSRSWRRKYYNKVA